MSNKIILKKSSVITANNPKLPQPSDLEYGELAVNYADSHETITLKNSNNEIVQIKSKEYNDANYAPKSHTHDEYLTTPMIATYTYDGYHNDAILAGFLNGDDNVETTNGAIIVLINNSGTDATIENSVNVECKGHVNITYTIQTDMPAFVVKDGESVSFVVMGNTLTPLISVAPGCVTKEYVDGVIEDNELVVAGALNEFNDSLTLKAEIDHNHDDVYSPTGHTHVSSDITDRVVTGTRILSGTTGLVEGRAVYGYAAPRNHASTATTYGVATTSNYGHVKISNGDVANVASVSGLAAGMDHTHSNYTERNEFEVWQLESGLGDIIWQAEEQSQDDEELLNTWLNNFNGSRVSSIWNDDPYSTAEVTSFRLNNDTGIHTITFMYNGNIYGANVNVNQGEYNITIVSKQAINEDSPSNINITATGGTGNYPLVFGPTTTTGGTITSGIKSLYTDNANNIYYNPSSNTLTVANINGLASSATTATLATIATKANTLKTEATIDGVNYNGSADVSHYVTCTNGGTTIAKTVAHPSFKLVTGARVSVKFSNDQGASAASGAITLKVGNTTAKNMYYKGEGINGTNLAFKSGLIYDFIYDGTNWVLQGEWDLFDPFTPITYGAINGITYDGRTDISNYVICDTAADEAAKKLKVPNIELTSGTVLYVKFTNGSTSTRIQFKINDDSSSNVKLRGASNFSLAGYNINNLDYYKFIFDGSYWWLMPNDIPVIVEISTANYNSTTSGNTLYTGVYYKFTSTASTSMNLTSIDSTTKQSFTMEITTGTSAPTITFPSTWKWVNGVFPVFEANKTYQISTFNNCAVCASFSTAS